MRLYVAMTLAVLALLMLFGGWVAWLIVRDTQRRFGRFGLGRFTGSCSNCNGMLPPIRMPTSVRQAFWGGHTCPTCTIELDRYGVPLAARCQSCGYDMRGSDVDRCVECGRPRFRDRQ